MVAGVWDVNGSWCDHCTWYWVYYVFIVIICWVPCMMANRQQPNLLSGQYRPLSSLVSRQESM